jgi:hypothetical protein
MSDEPTLAWSLGRFLPAGFRLVSPGLLLPIGVVAQPCRGRNRSKALAPPEIRAGIAG